MNNLTRYETEDGIELVIDQSTGEAYATQRGYARMSGKNQSTISRRVKGDALDGLKYAEIQTLGGLQGVQLIPESIISNWIIDDNPTLAKAMLKAGVRVFMHQMAGFKVASTPAQQPAPTPIPSQRSQVELEISVFKQCLEVANLDPRLVSGFLINHAGKRLPGTMDTVNEAHALLAAGGEHELLLTPTAIGKQLGLSAVKVNRLLEQIGYQYKNDCKGKGEPAYLPTEMGKTYSANTLATGKLYGVGADQTTYQHLKWKPEIVDVLREFTPLAG